MQPGTYIATATAASIWESQKGALMIDFDFVSDGQKITGSQCLVQKDGTVSEITIRTLKDCWGWDGQDPFWLAEPANLDGKEVEIVVEEESFIGRDGQERTAVKVRYINPVGGRRPEPADRKAVLAKYGAKFRALSGGSPIKKPAAPPAAPKPAAPASPVGPAATMQQAWDACCAAYPSDTETEWFRVIGGIVGDRDNSKVTPQEWAKIKAEFEDNVPM